VARSGCMDVLHALEAALARLPAAPAASLAASAPHACAAVDAVSDLDTRFLRAVLSLLHLVLVCGSADGTPLQTHHHTRVRVLLARAHGLALAAETARFLVAAPAAAPAAEPSLEMLQLSDAPLGSPRTPQPGTAGSLLALLGTADPAALYAAATSADGVSIVLRLLRDGVLWPLSELQRLLATRTEYVDAEEVGPCGAFVRGICTLGALSTSGGTPTVTAAAVAELCRALDHAVLLRAAQGASTAACAQFQQLIAVLYQQLCSAEMPQWAEHAAAFEVRLPLLSEHACWMLL
jgi:hypothetical protein